MCFSFRSSRFSDSLLLDQRRFKINAGAGERAAKLFFFQHFHNIQIDLLPHVHIGRIGAGFSIADYPDVQAAAAEILKIDSDAFVINAVMMLKIFTQTVDKGLHLLVVS